ncbi:PAS domain-containing protein [Methylobacterium durans]|uniref:PAS domain-containing protein n=1 Tax=Methylobacterium durans TaxID=2202825 RepID=UPI0013A54CB6|nr:PAS domain-containing protein [Methylobacterium durans]
MASTARLAFSSREMLRRIESFGLTGNWGWTFATEAHVWSPGLFRLLGLEPGIVRPSLGAFLAAIHPADRPSVELALGTMREGILSDRRFRVIGPDGSVRTLLGHSETYHAPDGRPIGAAGLVIDISDRERIGQAREIELRRRRSLFQETGAYFAHIPLDPFDPYPPELLELTGRRLEAFHDDWLCAIPAEEHGYWNGPLVQSWAGNRPFTYLYTQILGSGERVRYRGTFAPVLDATGGSAPGRATLVPSGCRSGRPGGSSLKGWRAPSPVGTCVRPARSSTGR